MTKHKCERYEELKNKLQDIGDHYGVWVQKKGMEIWIFISVVIIAFFLMRELYRLGFLAFLAGILVSVVLAILIFRKKECSPEDKRRVEEAIAMIDKYRSRIEGVGTSADFTLSPTRVFLAETPPIDDGDEVCGPQFMEHIQKLGHLIEDDIRLVENKGGKKR